MSYAKNIVITGGTSGIGLAIAQRFAREGHNILLVGSNPTKNYSHAVENVHHVAKSAGHEIHCSSYGVDITNFEALKEFMASLRKDVGMIDVLVHAAGVFFDTPIDANTPDAFNKMMLVNVNGTWNTIQAALPHIKQRESQGTAGKVVVISSISGFYGFAHYAGYSASKAAVTSLVKMLAMELGPRGININAVEPGRVKTSMHDAILKDPSQAETLRQIAASNPSGRAFSMPEDIANIVAFLASEAAEALHGTAIVADEGTTVGVMGA